MMDARTASLLESNRDALRSAAEIISLRDRHAVDTETFREALLVLAGMNDAALAEASHQHAQAAE